MRRDLTRGCAACRLRFSARNTHCPVCRAASLTVQEARSQVQPTSRAAWFAKWLVVLPSIPAIGAVIWAGTILLREGWPPKSAVDVVIHILGAMGTCLGASLAIGIPFAIWFGLVSFVQFILKFIVDRPRRALRITQEIAPRASVTGAEHPMHRLWDKLEAFITARIEAPARFWVITISVFLGLEALAEIFGESPVIKFTSWNALGDSLIAFGVTNGMGAMVFLFFANIFANVVKSAKKFFDKPPNLFGYDPTPPPLQNEACLATYMANREDAVGRAVPLDDAERAALETRSARHLTSPLSGQTCFAFRLVGDADGQEVDDADATSFAVITKDEKRCVVTTGDIMVWLEASTKIDAENARKFLHGRGLPEKNLDVREGLLREGDLVRVMGRRVELRVGTAGYRGDERRMMLDAGDGLPVVIREANEAPS